MLFQLYSDQAVTSLIGWVCVFVGLIVMNEIGRRTKFGGMLIFVIIPAILTVYFIASITVFPVTSIWVSATFSRIRLAFANGVGAK